MAFSDDEHGMLSSPSSFHDGHLLGLILGDGVLIVRLRDSRHQPFEMHLSALKRLAINDFREGDIINTVWILHRAKPPENFVRAIFGDLHPAVGSPYRERHEQAIERCVNDVAEGRSILVAVEPSYGCEFHALCGGVEIKSA